MTKTKQEMNYKQMMSVKVNNDYHLSSVQL